MQYEEMVSVLEDYLELQSTEDSKPDWFEALSFLAGYFGTLTVDMVMAVRKYQREGRIN